MKEQKCKILQISKLPVLIYHRMMRYPVFPPTKTYYEKNKKIIHKLNEYGSVIAIPSDTTVEDFEKLCALMYLVKNNKAQKIDTEYYDKESKTEVTIIESSLYELKKITNCHSYLAILESLIKISNMTIIYDFINSKNQHEKIFIKPIFKVVLVEGSYKIKIHFMKQFFDCCFNKGLYFDLDILLKLPPIAKNVYLYLLANMDKKIFCREKIISRCLIYAKTKKDQIKLLKRALQALQKFNVIKGYQINAGLVSVEFSKINKVTKVDCKSTTSTSITESLFQEENKN